MKLIDCQEIVAAPDLQTLESRLEISANDLGFGIISGVFVVRPVVGPTSVQEIGKTPQGFQSQRNSSLRKRDPVMRRLKQLSAPFTYDQSTYVNESAGDMWGVQAQYGYKTGLAMSLHLPDSQHFVLGVDREQPLPRDEVVLARMMADFHLLAAHAQLAAQRILGRVMLDTPHRPPLTKRELEVLQWTSDGKSSWAVGQILGISEHTVNFHVQGAMRKLGTSSKHQAAAKARSLDLI